MKPIFCVLAACLGVAMAGVAQAQGFTDQFRTMAEDSFREWTRNPAILAAVRAQNSWTSKLNDAAIESLDQKWRAEVEAGGGPTIDPVLNNPAAAYLRGRASESQDQIAELFVTDARGLNVAASAMTSDYFQGDEAKYQQTFPNGAGAVFVDSLEFDVSSKTFQTQVSLNVVDPNSGEPIGVMTVGVTFASDAPDKLAYGEFLSADCTGCHQVQSGVDSRSQVGAPDIINLPVDDFLEKMERQKASRSMEMRDAAANLSVFELEALAIYLSTIKPE